MNLLIYTNAFIYFLVPRLLLWSPSSLPFPFIALSVWALVQPYTNTDLLHLKQSFPVQYFIN